MVRTQIYVNVDRGNLVGWLILCCRAESCESTMTTDLWISGVAEAVAHFKCSVSLSIVIGDSRPESCGKLDLGNHSVEGMFVVEPSLVSPTAQRTFFCFWCCLRISCSWQLFCFAFNRYRSWQGRNLWEYRLREPCRLIDFVSSSRVL